MSTFADEVRQMGASKAGAGDAGGASKAATAGEPLMKGAEVLDHVLPTGTSPVEPGAPVVKVIKVEVPAKEETGVEPPNGKVSRPAEEKIRIGGKEFANLEEATKYAEELILADREEKAFQEGYKKAVAKDEQAAEPKRTWMDDAYDKFFEDPRAALEAIRNGVRTEIIEEYRTMTTVEKEQQVRQQEQAQTWDSFYKANADLAESRDYVDFMLKKNWNDLKDEKTEVALEKLAEITRKGLKISKESALPRTELQNKPAVMAGVGDNATTAEAPATVEKAIDFISQLNKLRKRKQG